MKTNRLYVLTLNDQRGGLFRSKLFVVALVLALLVSIFPAASVFAAPAGSHDITEDNNLEQEWSNKLVQLRSQSLFYDEIRLYPADFDNLADLARAHYFLGKYGFALRQANTIVLNHAGFDIQGQVVHVKHADQSVHDLAMVLHTMRGLREKLDEVRP